MRHELRFDIISTTITQLVLDGVSIPDKAGRWSTVAEVIDGAVQITMEVNVKHRETS